MKQIICIGNRYVSEDAAGPWVYDFLKQKQLPPDITLIDGGLSGLDLLRFVEKAERVIFVDRLLISDKSDDVVILKANELFSEMTTTYDHSSGLPYLLRMLPIVCEGMLPDILIVGIAGNINQVLIEKAAMIAVELADKGNFITL
ncbi:MAG: hydrogenase maturation protease [Desulfobacterales bacterium]|nr:hydrogenase maturation protease [Desulfobacterales bacterium]